MQDLTLELMVTSTLDVQRARVRVMLMRGIYTVISPVQKNQKIGEIHLEDLTGKRKNSS